MDRDTQGRFAKGNKGGPGRPAKDVEEAYLDVLYSEVSLDDWRKIVRCAKDLALEGDYRARGWLGRWLIAPAVRVREKEIDFMETLKQSWPRK